MLRVLVVFGLAVSVVGHGQMNFPPSTRQVPVGKGYPGALTGPGSGGYCEQPHGAKAPGNNLNGGCMLFSQAGTPPKGDPKVAVIPGTPTNNLAKYRTHNIHVSSGPNDWTRTKPWRAPGSAPVFGSGCGTAGGGPQEIGNGGWPATGMKQGEDPLHTLQGPAGGPVTKWKRGSNVTVAWGMWANRERRLPPRVSCCSTASLMMALHGTDGGGYSYRLCKNEHGKVNESCFQQTPLRFASADTQWLQHTNGSKYPIALTKLSVGTTPAGSEWARVPIPGCLVGNCSKGIDPATGKPYPCPEGYPNGAHGFSDSCTKFQFPEPLPGLHGFGYTNNNEMRPDVVHGGDSASEGPNGGDHFHDYSIVDEVVVPVDLEPGDYLLSWRWDCEQTTQIWRAFHLLCMFLCLCVYNIPVWGLLGAQLLQRIART